MINRHNDFPIKLKQLRVAGRLTQNTLAKEINVSRSCLANYESGKRFPDADILSIIADYFKVSISYLLSEKSSVCTDKSLNSTSMELIKEISSTGKLDISHISPLSKIALFEYYNFLCEQEQEDNTSNRL